MKSIILFVFAVFAAFVADAGEVVKTNVVGGVRVYAITTTPKPAATPAKTYTYAEQRRWGTADPGTTPFEEWPGSGAVPSRKSLAQVKGGATSGQSPATDAYGFKPFAAGAPEATTVIDAAPQTATPSYVAVPFAPGFGSGYYGGYSSYPYQSYDWLNVILYPRGYAGYYGYGGFGGGYSAASSFYGTEKPNYTPPPSGGSGAYNAVPFAK